MSKKPEQKNQRIQVFARCRPLNAHEKKQGASNIVEVIPERKEIVLKNGNVHKEFYFDKVFPPDAKQITVYKSVVQPLIQEVLMGYNCTVFAYGQTGTGKTYTMEGERYVSECSWEDDPGAGIIPRSLHQLFEELNKGSKGEARDSVEYSVRVSFLELYNEELFDLLGTDFQKLRLFEDSNRKGSLIIQNLSESTVNTKDEVYAILEKGTARRQTAATQLNASSSRSHTVFSVTVYLKENTIDGEELVKTGKLNLVDLAGSENVGRSGAHDKRAREAGNINQSLLTLGRVITALTEKQPHIPYRESKLTRLLQDSLGGHTKTSIIATISAASFNLDETSSTLEYAMKAKNITIHPEVNQRMTKRALIREYTEKIQQLTKDLAAARNNEGFYIDRENYVQMQNEIENFKRSLKQSEDRNELFEEEITKFNALKMDFARTSELLDQIQQQKQIVEAELSKTYCNLAHTEKVLCHTVLERDEKAFEIRERKDTEKKLTETAENVIRVAGQAVSDNDQLHAKIGRKASVERTNEEKCKQFQSSCHQLFLKMDNMAVGDAKQFLGFTDVVKDSLSASNAEVSAFKSAFNKSLCAMRCQYSDAFERLVQQVQDQAQSGKDWGDSHLVDINCMNEALNKMHDDFLEKTLPTWSNAFLESVNAITNNVSSVANEVQNQVDKQNLLFQSRIDEQRKMLCQVDDEISTFCATQEDIVSELSAQIQSLSDSLDGEMRLSEIIRKTSEELIERQSRSKNILSQIENSKNKVSEDNRLNLVRETLNEEIKRTEHDPTILDSMCKIVNPDKFKTLTDVLMQKQEDMKSGIYEYINDSKKVSDNDLLKRTTAVKTYKETLSKVAEEHSTEIQSLSASIQRDLRQRESCVEDYVKKHVEMNGRVSHLASQKKEDVIGSAARMKKQILNCDVEVERFLEGLSKDVPTGATPQRKDYIYPTSLPATSPEERIQQRFRQTVAANSEGCGLAENSALGSRDPLPKLTFDASLNDSEVLRVAHLERSPTDGASSEGLAFSDESDCTESGKLSNASSTSDLYIESTRDKENVDEDTVKDKAKKKGRKKFLKPPTVRTPLVSKNSS